MEAVLGKRGAKIVHIALLLLIATIVVCRGENYVDRDGSLVPLVMSVLLGLSLILTAGGMALSLNPADSSGSPRRSEWPT